MTSRLEPERTDPVLELLAGRARAQAVSTIAALGVADVLAEGPLSCAALADAVGCVPDRLRPVLRVLAGVGLFECPEPDVFALTESGHRLRKDQLGPLAATLGTPCQWEPWARLREALAGGPSPFERRFGKPLYDHLAEHPADAEQFDTAIDAYTRVEAEALCAAHDFSGAETVVDIGGGRGTLLRAVLDRWDHLHGILFDLPHVVDPLRTELETAGPGRLSCVAGDFEAEVPEADAYILKHVLHNWPDVQAAELLRRCARAMRPGGNILVMDAVLTPGTIADSASLLDLEMLVMTEGRERRKPELRQLFHSAGLVAERFQPLTPTCWLIVGTTVRPSGAPA